MKRFFNREPATAWNAAWYAMGLTLTLTVAIMVVGCGDGNSPAGGNQQSEPGDKSQGDTAEVGETLPEPMTAFQGEGNVLEITIEGNDQMKYDTEQFSVKPGQMVRLTLEHVGTLPASSMGHNVVIIQQGEDFMEFTADVNEQGANLQNDYLPEAVYDRVIAFTEMVGGGDTTTVEFKAPEEPGDYPYLCTFPGHAVQMNGTMTVEGQ